MSTCIEDLILDHQADFIGLQETTKKNYSESFFRKVDPLKSFVWHWLPAKGRSGGLLCGVKTERFEVREFSIVANVIDKKNLKKLILATVYGPAHAENKEKFLMYNFSIVCLLYACTICPKSVPTACTI